MRTFTTNSFRYFELINKTDRTKEEARELEQLKHEAEAHSVIIALDNIVANTVDADGHATANILEYENCAGLYRLQARINGKMKTIARIKVAKRDVYILVRESTARALNINDYEIINYNLPAGYHRSLKEAYNELYRVYEHHFKAQTA